MKKLLLFLSAAFLAISAASAQERIIIMPDLEPTAEYNDRIGVGLSLISGGSEGFIMGGRAWVDYGRHIKGKFYVGGGLKYEAISVFCGDSFNLITLMANAYWELPVAGQWLAFRCGGGLGLGYSDPSFNERGPKTISPYLNIRLEWVIKCSRSFELNFAPLLIGPSIIEWSPFAPVGWNRFGHMVTTDIFHFGFGFRF